MCSGVICPPLFSSSGAARDQQGGDEGVAGKGADKAAVPPLPLPPFPSTPPSSSLTMYKAQKQLTKGFYGQGVGSLKGHLAAETASSPRTARPLLSCWTKSADRCIHSHMKHVACPYTPRPSDTPTTANPWFSSNQPPNRTTEPDARRRQVPAGAARPGLRQRAGRATPPGCGASNVCDPWATAG